MKIGHHLGVKCAEPHFYKCTKLMPFVKRELSTISIHLWLNDLISTQLYERWWHVKICKSTIPENNAVKSFVNNLRDYFCQTVFPGEAEHYCLSDSFCVLSRWIDEWKAPNFKPSKRIRELKRFREIHPIVQTSALNVDVSQQDPMIHGSA